MVFKLKNTELTIDLKRICKAIVGACIIEKICSAIRDIKIYQVVVEVKPKTTRKNQKTSENEKVES